MALNRVHELAGAVAADLILDAAEGKVRADDLLRWVEGWHAERQRIRGMGGMKNLTE